MNKRFLLSILLAMCFVAGWAQTGNEKKLSVTTQMFLQEMAGDITFGRDTKTEQQLGLIPIDADLRKSFRDFDRLYATPDTIGGQVFIAAYIRLYDNSNTGDLEALGVEVQSKFGNELITANIPVNKIMEVAALPIVKHINVSPLRKPTTFIARQKTNVDDVLTRSADAINKGLPKAYDGTGVLLGVIDTGIDFQHIAFKDSQGNSRIKKAYVYNGSSATEYDSSTIGNATTDDKTGDHGTHTSSTAGGSSVIITGDATNGYNFEVTEDHGAATYGGMAPGADLYLAGVKSLSSTYLDNAVQKIVEYADANNMPVVVSNSWGSQLGPHDGTGDVAEVYSDLFGDGHPNHIALFAASNDGGKSKDNEGGGYHVSGMSSKAAPLESILRAGTYINTDAGYMYMGIIANAWAQNPAVKEKGLAMKIMVLDSQTGEELYSKEVTPDDYIVSTSLSIAGLGKYYSGTLNAYFDQVESDKTQIILYSSSGITSKGTSSTARNGYDPYYLSKYTLAVQVYPVDETLSTVVDVWGGNYGYFTDHLNTTGHTWTDGSDDMCVSDEATMPDAISIGAYVSERDWTDYAGVSHTEPKYEEGDIAYFSSYATADQSPTGQFYPWITAPGARLIAGVNHNHTASVDDYSYYGDDFNSDLVVNDANYPYAEMEGTSMATPTAAGIVALWLQAAKENNRELTVNDVKTIMKETAITDYYTNSGPNYTHFGNGKIDALAGIKYIIGPTIVTDIKDINFSGYLSQSYTQTIQVSGVSLQGDITVTKSGGVFTVDKNTITAADAHNGTTLTVTWAPTAEEDATYTITLSSTGAETVTITVKCHAEDNTPTIVVNDSSNPVTLNITADKNTTKSQTINVKGRFLSEMVTATVSGDKFSVSPDAVSAALVQSDEGATLTVSFTPTDATDYTGTLTLTSEGAAPVNITLNGTGTNSGTAANSYLNIANYATIDDAGWNTTYVNTLYNYTRYEDQEVAWLTMPVYGAWSTVKLNNQSQKWIDSDVSSTGTTGYDNESWTNTPTVDNPFMGSSKYFTGTSGNGQPRVIGGTALDRTVSFNVTNVKAVKLYGKHTSIAGIDAASPAKLTVTETGNPSTIVTSTDSPFILSINNLDPQKVYKVDAFIDRGSLYEIAFQTPIEVEKTVSLSLNDTNIDANGIQIITAKDYPGTQVFHLTGTNVKNLVNVAITSDANNWFSVSKQAASNGNTNHMPRRLRGGNSLTLTPDEVSNGIDLAVSFTPNDVAVNYQSTLVLSTDGMAEKTIPLKGNSITPSFTVAPTSITFDTGTAGDSYTKTFSVLSLNPLSGPVSVDVTSGSNVFSTNVSSVSVDDALAGAIVNVTFTPNEAGNFTGTIELSSPNADSKTISLSGSATDAYFDATISSVGLSTMYLDFPVSIPYEQYDPDLLGVYYIYDTSNQAEYKLARLNSTIPANTGVILQGNAGVYRFLKINEAAPLTRTNYLRGSVEEITVEAALAAANSNGIVMTLGRGKDSYINFYRYSGKKLPPYKAFIIYEGDTNVKEFSISLEDGVATSIISNQDIPSDDNWYTLQGIKLDKKPVKGGIYIHNGKAVPVK